MISLRRRRRGPSVDVRYRYNPRNCGQNRVPGRASRGGAPKAGAWKVSASEGGAAGRCVGGRDVAAS
jgi:hypothetical protein